MTREKIQELMIYALDNELTTHEQSILQEGMIQFPSLSDELDSLKEIRQLLGKQKLAPSPTFVNQLMGHLDQAKVLTIASFETTMLHLFPKIAAACVILLLVTLLNTYIGEGSISTETLVGIIDLSPDEAFSVLADGE